MVRFFVFYFSLFFCALPVSAAPYRLLLEFVPPPETLYMGQEVSFQIKLFDRVGLKDISVVPVNWQNIDVFLDSKQPDETVVVNGATYNVKTLYFSLVAKSTGKMSFSPLCLSALAPTMISMRDLPPDVRIVNGRVEICASSFSFEVKPLPAHPSPLFAAEHVELFEGVLPKNGSVKQGSPVKRSLVLTAKGTLPVYLPDFQTPDLENVRIYKGKTDRSMISLNKTLISALRQTVVFIPEQSGNLILPEIKVFWLNTQTNQIEESKIPPYTLTVLSSGGQIDDQKSLPSTENDIHVEETPVGISYFFMKMTGGWLLLLFAVSASIVFLKKRRRQKMLIKAVEQSCLAADPEKVAAALLIWAKDKFPDRRIINLSDIRECFNGHADAFIEALNELDLFLYGTGRFARHLPIAKEMSGKLLQAFYLASQVKTKKNVRQKKYLPDLYPDQ